MNRRFASFNSLAKQELAEAASFYELEASGLGKAFLKEVESAVEGLLAHPESGPVARGLIRRKVLSRFSYTLIYRLRGDEIRILAVMHQKRRPSYWVGRG